MKYRGREIDPLTLWDRYVDLPADASEDSGPFLKLVYCPNPEHDNTRTPSFQINISQPTVHCFAQCGISGSYERAISIIEGCDEREARKTILRGALAAPSKRQAPAKSASKPAPTVSDLAYDRFLPQAGLEYLKRRGISEGSVATWELGWNYDELRIVIPALDEHRKLRFLIERATRLKDEPKYLYSEGFAKTSLLFGACNLDMALVKSLGLILTEGSLDTIRLHQHDLRNAVAILGTGISQAQRNIVARMRPRRIYFMFDKDLAGVTNIEIAAKSLRKYPCFVCRYPKGVNDPGEISREQAHRSIARAVPALKWLAENYPSVNLRGGNFGHN